MISKGRNAPVANVTDNDMVEMRRVFNNDGMVKAVGWAMRKYKLGVADAKDLVETVTRQPR